MKIQEGKIVDIINKRIFNGKVFYDENQIIKITEELDVEFDNYILPGFIDSHIHIESTMLTPSEFARKVVENGTVAVMADPHEIANVCGREGVEFMLNDAEDICFKIYFGIPSCVPATPFELCGGDLDSEKVDNMFASGKYTFLAEFMNVPGLLEGNKECVLKVESAKAHGKPIDGHAPGLYGEDLLKYTSYGISTDHEFFSIENSIEKIKSGMKLQIREGSASKDFDHLFSLIDKYPNDVMFCTDDSHPNDLINLGHIDKIVKMAVSKGLNIFNILRAASVNPVFHYGVNVGLLREGDSSDFIVVKDLTNFDVLKTVINGVVVFENGKSYIKSKSVQLINNFNTRNIDLNDLTVFGNNNKRIKLMSVEDGSLLTTKKYIYPKLNKKGEIVSDIEKDILKIILHNRYSNQPVQIGFIEGFGLKQGAFATSISHDSHNIIAVGVSDEDIVSSVNAIVEKKGGISVSLRGNVDILELPIAGLMSNKDIETVSNDYISIKSKAKELGCKLNSPFMTLAFMSLIVLPELKLGAYGLFDYEKFEFVSLFED